MPLTIKELVVYVPSQDFEVSRNFYSALGFELTEGFGGTMDCRLGGAVFRLQNYYVKDWANNFMMKLDVDDVDEWYQHVKKRSSVKTNTAAPALRNPKWSATRKYCMSSTRAECC